MIENDNKTVDIKLYSQKAIGIATFLGGPLAAGYIIRENYLALNKPDEGYKAMAVGIISTLILFLAIFLIPDNIMDKVPNQIFPIIYTAIIYSIVEKIHGEVLKQHEENGNEFFSAWKAAGVGVVSLSIMFGVIFGYILLSTNNSEFENYDKEIAVFSKNETETLAFYDHIDTKGKFWLLKNLKENAIPKWKENIEIIKRLSLIENLPVELVEQNKILLKYSKLRLKVFELYQKAIQEDTDIYSLELDWLHSEIDIELKKLE